MPERMPTETTNLDRYGNEILPWDRPRDQLVAGPSQPGTSFFLATSSPDGSPHLAAVGVIWHDGDLFFTSGPGTRKARNLAANPACGIAICLDGIDLVVQGQATRVDDRKVAETVIAVFRRGGWPAELDGARIVGPYSAPSAGPPPWDIYRFIFHTAFGVATTEPDGATRWRFAGA